MVVGALSVILGLRLGSPLELGSPRVLKARCIKTSGLARKGSRFKIFQSFIVVFASWVCRTNESSNT